MTQTLQSKYPWHHTKRGESFFVPALDVHKTALEGQQLAVILIGHAGIRSKPVIFQGVLGVMFTRR